MEDHCVCCGRIVPEGQQVCLVCEAKVNAGSRIDAGSSSLWRWFHDLCVAAYPGRHGRRGRRHPSAGDLLSE